MLVWLSVAQSARHLNKWVDLTGENVVLPCPMTLNCARSENDGDLGDLQQGAQLVRIASLRLKVVKIQQRTVKNRASNAGEATKLT